MMGTSHAATGAAAWVILGPLVHVNPAAVAATVPVAAIAALGPDIDHEKSTISRILPFVGWPIQQVTTHRIQMHSLAVAALVVGALFPVAGLTITAAVAVGWVIGHIGADCLTDRGCALLWPLTRARFGLGIMTTGEIGEKIYAIVLWPCVLLYYLAAIKQGWLT